MVNYQCIYFSHYHVNMKTLAKRLLHARDLRELSQQQLADLAGVSQGAIGHLESGLRQTSRKITAIAAALDVSVAWLAEGKGDMAANSEQQPKMALAYVAPDEIELLTKYRESTTKGKSFIKDAADAAEKSKASLRGVGDD